MLLLTLCHSFQVMCHIPPHHIPESGLADGPSGCDLQDRTPSQNSQPYHSHIYMRIYIIHTHIYVCINIYINRRVGCFFLFFLFFALVFLFLVVFWEMTTQSQAERGPLEALFPARSPAQPLQTGEPGEQGAVWY